MIKWDLFQGSKDASVSANQSNVKHNINKRKDTNYTITVSFKDHILNRIRIFVPILSLEGKKKKTILPVSVSITK